MKKSELSVLGKTIPYPQNPSDAHLEAIPFISHKSENVTVTLESDEFTSLCPVTGQPDFGRIKIEFIPGKFIVESKSLKLYLFSFRNIGIFQEKLILKIHNDLKKAIKPNYIKVTGYFKPRGGISITPVVESFCVKKS